MRLKHFQSCGDVPNLEAGIAFYQAVCGFTEKARPFATMAILDGNIGVEGADVGSPGACED
jgi:catechol 2,3-dioxygenase-like lactoylglutathione lyase family enzyme